MPAKERENVDGGACPLPELLTDCHLFPDLFSRLTCGEKINAGLHGYYRPSERADIQGGMLADEIQPVQRL